MNEARTIFRVCVTCGKQFKIELASKKHWWQGRKILTDCFHMHSLNMREMKRGWFSKWFPFDCKPKRFTDRIMCKIFWWWTSKEEECSMPNRKKPYYMLKDKIEDFLDPPEMVEYWECPECLKKVKEDD